MSYTTISNDLSAPNHVIHVDLSDPSLSESPQDADLIQDMHDFHADKFNKIIQLLQEFNMNSNNTTSIRYYPSYTGSSDSLDVSGDTNTKVLYLIGDTSDVYIWDGSNYIKKTKDTPNNTVSTLTYPGVSSFPATGSDGQFYFDGSTGEVYYWNAADSTYYPIIAGLQAGSMMVMHYADLTTIQGLAAPEGENSGILYFANDTGLIYRWDGSEYTTTGVVNNTNTGVVEIYDTFSDLKTAHPTGSDGVIYIARDTEYLYIWDSTDNTYKTSDAPKTPNSSDVQLYVDYDHFPGNSGNPSATPDTSVIYIANDTDRVYTYDGTNYNTWEALNTINSKDLRLYDDYDLFPGNSSNPSATPSDTAIYMARDTGNTYYYSNGDSSYHILISNQDNSVKHYTNYSAFSNTTGEVGTIYIADDTGYMYSWDAANNTFITADNSANDNANTVGVELYPSTSDFPSPSSANISVIYVANDTGNTYTCNGSIYTQLTSNEDNSVAMTIALG